MKIAFSGLILATSLILAGCNTTSTGTSTAGIIAGDLTNTLQNTANTLSPVLSNDTNSTISKIQQATVAACSFLPTTLTITSLFNHSTALSTTSDVVNAICGSVNTAVTNSNKVSNRRYGSGKTVVTSYDGVIIQGHFVN